MATLRCDLPVSVGADWQSYLARVGVRLAPPVHALQMGGARGRARKVSFLIFDADSPRPVLVVKVARSPEAVPQLEAEFRVLTELEALEALTDRLPRALGFFDWHGRAALAETYVPGTSIAARLRRHQQTHPRQVRADLRIASDWLKRMQSATRSGTANFDARGRAEVWLAELGVWAKALPADFADRLRGVAAEFDGTPMPRCGRHGDFWPGNLLLDGKVGRVVDWEGFVRGELPHFDACHHATTYAQTYPWQGWRRSSKVESFDRAFASGSWYAGLAREFVADVLHGLGLPNEMTRSLFWLYLLEKAADEARCGAGPEGRPGEWMQMLVSLAKRRPDGLG